MVKGPQQMPKIIDLNKKLETIPGKSSRKNLVGKLGQYNTISNLAANALGEALQASYFAEKVFPEINLNAVTSNSTSARNSAGKIVAKLRADVQNIQNKFVEDKFVELKEAVTRAQSNIKEAWRRSVETKVKGYSGLIKAANDAGLSGSKSLQSTLDRLETESTHTPANTTDVSRITAYFEQLENAVARLDLKGKAGEFLIAVASDGASPRHLLDPEVVEFIEKYDLWSTLTVKLR